MTRSHTQQWSWLLWTFLGGLSSGPLRIARAQRYDISGEAMPEKYSMQLLYMFYVYGREDAPAKDLSDTTAPYVQFTDISIDPTDPIEHANANLDDYYSVQLALVKEKDFFNLINVEEFCCLPRHVPSHCQRKGELKVKTKGPNQAYKSVGVYNFTLPFSSAKKNREAHNPSHRLVPVNAEDDKEVTGVYTLLLSNCGDIQNGTLKGQIVVKNAYGFLPGNEYDKLPFYGWMSMLYMALAVVWMGISFRWWREIVAIHNCITAVIMLGLLEAFLWWLHYNEWNDTGFKSDFKFIVSLLTSVVKNVFSYMLVLVASLGWGVTRLHLDAGIMLRIQGITGLYIVLASVKEAVTSIRRSHALPGYVLLICLLPVAILNGIIFYWVFTALANLTESLQDRGQTEKLTVFTRLWWVLVAAITMATFTLLYHMGLVAATTDNSVDRWGTEWRYTDGMPHILFLLVLMAMMYLWAPHEHSKMYAYSPLERREEAAGADKKAVDTWVDIDEEGADKEEEDSFWNATKGAEMAKRGVEPTKIGAESETQGEKTV